MTQDQEQTELLNKFRRGQIWQDRKRKPESVMMIVDLYVRVYSDGKQALRVVGIESHQSHHDVDGPILDRAHPSPPVALDADAFRDLDARSMEKMYPYNSFEPYQPYPEEDK